MAEQGRDSDLQELVDSLADVEAKDTEETKPDETAEQGKEETPPEQKPEAAPEKPPAWDKNLQKLQQEMGNLRRQMEDMAKAKAEPEKPKAPEEDEEVDVDPYKLTPKLAKQLKELDQRYEAMLKAQSDEVQRLKAEVTERRVVEFRKQFESDPQNEGLTFDEVAAAVEKELAPYEGDKVPDMVWRKLVQTTWDQQALALRQRKSAAEEKTKAPAKKSTQGAKVVGRSTAVTHAPESDGDPVVVEDRFIQGLLGDD